MTIKSLAVFLVLALAIHQAQAWDGTPGLDCESLRNTMLVNKALYNGDAYQLYSMDPEATQITTWAAYVCENLGTTPIPNLAELESTDEVEDNFDFDQYDDEKSLPASVLAPSFLETEDPSTPLVEDDVVDGLMFLLQWMNVFGEVHIYTGVCVNHCLGYLNPYFVRGTFPSQTTKKVTTDNPTIRKNYLLKEREMLNKAYTSMECTFTKPF